MVLQRIRIAAIVRIEADADAARDVELVHLDEKRPRQLVEDLATDHRRILGSADAAEQNDELVAAGARPRVGGAHAGRQSLRAILQQQLADPLPEGVIYGLEQVKIDKQNRQDMSVAFGGGERKRGGWG